jgi:amino acid efflux transporter
VLLTTGSFVTVYALGVASALRLLPRGSWAQRGARVALGAVIGCVATGWYLLWPLAITVCALFYLHWREQIVADAGS